MSTNKIKGLEEQVTQTVIREETSCSWQLWWQKNKITNKFCVPYSRTT